IVGGEVFLVARPPRDGVDDAADQLLDAVLALGRADLAAEILRDNDVGGLLGPGGRDFNVALLENDLPLFVSDDRRADLPFDLVERVNARQREVAWKIESLDRLPPGICALFRPRFDGSARSLDRSSFHARSSRTQATPARAPRTPSPRRASDRHVVIALRDVLRGLRRPWAGRLQAVSTSLSAAEMVRPARQG